MPFKPSSRRGLTDNDLAAVAAAEDSNDDDYDDRQPARSPRKQKSRRGGSSLPKKKSRRAGYRGSDISDDEDDDDISEQLEWTGESDQEEPETNERGRPVRKAVQKRITYEESDSDPDDLAKSSSDGEEPSTPQISRRAKSKIVTLKVRTPLQLPATTRSLRDRKSSLGARSQPPSLPAGRRSRRLSHDEEEGLIELSSSGRHAIVVRAGSREPEQAQPRPSRASKGIKFPSKSTIDEADEPPSQPKEEEDEEMEIKASQHEQHEDEVPASQLDLPDQLPQLLSDLPRAAEPEIVLPSEDPLQMSPERREPIAPDYEPLSDVAEGADDAMVTIPPEDDDDDEGPLNRGRSLRGGQKRKAESPPADEPPAGRRKLRARGNNGRAASAAARGRPDETSDFEPEGEAEEAEDVSDSAESDNSPRKGSQRVDEYDSSNAGRRSTRLKAKVTSRQASGSDEDEEQELAEEVAELTKSTSKRKRPVREEVIFETRGRRNAGRKNYDLLRNLPQIEEDDEPAAPSPSQRARKTGGGWQRNLFNTYGPFGGAGGRSLLGGPGRPADADSDSSDDEIMKQPKPLGGAVGMTPTTASAAFANPFAMNTLNSDPAQAPSGTPANLGKIKDKQALADADPLGVDQNVDFDSVGGLAGHIDQLKEMVALPLLYPEIFMRFKITPPRGVLFHGPPGTGKTLLARALATSVSSQGRKVTFYMRKGADALSKWVGEAERQLRMLFEEARKNQPSIIFFDEIDGLAPVRSSKQEQIHASIVSTLLALMDGMDGRGQVIVIGATNRPDSIDPALRRPGRFDREFYFPLPDTEARRAIIQIHTRGWNPPLDDDFKDEVAELTKGYGGADLRALCTEAALNAVQRRYPQIYKSKEKLLIDPKTIQVTAKDFMISIKKMTPSSERSASSGASPLPPIVAPLLSRPLAEIEQLLAELLPQKKKTTPLEEAMYEDVADGKDKGFGRERMQQAFESSRVFRPRLLVHGKMGMGQQYVVAALLNHFQGIHVQSFDLATLLSDNASSAESTVIRLFSEVKMHKPSVIYIPNVQEWYSTVGPVVLTTFFGLLRSIKPTDPILVMGFMEGDPEEEDASMKRELFGYSQRNQYLLDAPNKEERHAFFTPLKEYIITRPSDFPDPTQRKKRQMEILPPAPLEPARPPPPLSKEELKAQKKKDRQTLNMLKIRLQPIMDQIRTRYKKFRTGVIDESTIRYLYDEADPGTVTSDVAQFPIALASYRPFEVGKDAHGVTGLVDQATSKFYYNLDSVTIEKRLSNGYYKRPKDFLADVKRLAKDAKAIEDEDRLLKANELLANVEVDVAAIEINEPVLAAECERVYQRELQREKEAQEKEQATQKPTTMPPPRAIMPNGSDIAGTTTTEGTGQIRLGETFTNAKDTLGRVLPVTPSRMPSHSTVMTNGFYDATTAVSHHHQHHSSNHTGSGHEADAENDTPVNTSNMNSTSKTSGETQKTHTTSSFGASASAQPRPYYMHTAPSQQLQREHGMANQLSQVGYMTPMQAGSQPADYINEASTTQTTSGQKHNSGHSGPSDPNNTQESGPNLYMYDERRSAGGTDVPDTQENTGMLMPHAFDPMTPTSERCTKRRKLLHAMNPPPLPHHSSKKPVLTGPPENYLPSQGSANGSRSVSGSSQSQSQPSHYVTARPSGSSHGQGQGQPSGQPPFPPIPHFEAPINTTQHQLSPTRPSASTSAFTTAPSKSLTHTGTHTTTQPLSHILNPAPSGPRQPNHETAITPNLQLPTQTALANTLVDLTDKSSGLSVEQLEQVNSVLMDILWKTRGEWDRRLVLQTLVEGFNEVLEDMKGAGQSFGELSWEGIGVGGGGRRIGV